MRPWLTPPLAATRADVARLHHALRARRELGLFLLVEEPTPAP
jgi:hypothetical protein